MDISKEMAHLRDTRWEIKQELVEAKARIAELEAALTGLNREKYAPAAPCFCGKAIDDPRMSGHSGPCLKAREALKGGA